MNFGNGREKLKVAIECDELDLFLGGRGIYRLGYNIYAPGDSMLDIEPTMGEIYRYYLDEPENRVDLELEKTIFEFLSYNDGSGVYAAFTILRYQLINEKLGEAPFRLNYEKIKKEFDQAYRFYVENLKNLREYEGEMFQEGLWEAMQKENKRCIEDYGIDILAGLDV